MRLWKNQATTNQTALTIEGIQRMVAEYYDIRLGDMTSKQRPNNIAFPRQIAMYLCREMTDLSLPKIGELFGGRDHTTVIHAYEKVNPVTKLGKFANGKPAFYLKQFGKGILTEGFYEETCPKCGSSNIKVTAIITGYLSQVNKFNKAKEAERKDRVSHGMKNSLK